MNTKHLNPWFGVVPIHWQNGQLKRFYSVRLGKMLQPNPSNPQDELVHYVRAANITWAGPDISDIKMMWASSSEIDNNQLEAGDLLVSEGGDVGRSCLWSVEIPRCIFQNAINRIRPRNENSTKFLRYVMEAVKGSGWIDTICNKATIAHFTAEKTNELDIPIPTPFHQRGIAAYLDEQTAKIDHLMALRRRQMELLKEQRAAAIQQAVTRGLNPNAPMKDSGVSWLGEIPAHWKVKRLRYLVEKGLVNGLFKKSEQFGSGAKLVNVFDIYRDDFIVDIESLDSVEVSESEKKQFSVEQGDLFFVRSSLKASGIARAACMGAVTEPTVFECHLVKSRPKKTIINPLFLSFFLNSDLSRNRLVSLAKTTTMTTIEQMKLADIEIPLLPLIEQKSILDFIYNENAKIEGLHASYACQLTILAEYRAALIHECVTGQRQV